MMRGEIPSRHRKSFVHRRLAKNPNLALKLQQMALPLAPLIELDKGGVHPAFPRTVLNFWLLTDEQLESLAQFYHQKTPNEFSRLYPCPITWSPDMTLEEKRRRMGKFIGLRGCESPIMLKTEEEIMAEVRLARQAAEEEMWRRKRFPWQS
ncbi:hypothetical protein BGZ61DRAFT_337376 [Ilyonectria robusta]|uniref:uncharacterized protein n=1 Tax=Ilyonectria robusta TaxID=1079257 RepID=UPI001E8CD8E3|nr:uncharacterized protein BGZ61DRAFT_337376 [Ilyonectria robusta]KAH6997630.1 hypothetical protein BKA56DRAFT_4685 [Ilyonectria sp. MPI-CAGE-AT-0026]KAH8736800.1 hypothetical protein BGZ61DRAFT_337376 [Ilyonectria robusta]